MTRGPPTGGVPSPNPLPPRGGGFAYWDFTTGIGVDFPPTFIPVQVPPGAPQIPPHQVFLDLSVQNAKGKPPDGHGGGPTIGYGVTTPRMMVQNKGKYYFEIEYTQRTDPSNGFPATFNGGIAIGPLGQNYAGYAADYFGFGASASTGVVCNGSGRIIEDGLESGFVLPVSSDPNIGSLQEGDIIGVAVDLDHGLVWFQCVEGPSLAFAGGLWNGTLNSNPNTLTFGATLSKTSSILPYAIFGGETFPQAVTMQANFGFTGFFFISSVNYPIGYRNWPITTVT